MSSGTLFVTDSRTQLRYEIPIRRNAILATEFKKIKAPIAGADRADHGASGLRVHDPGLQNTTVVETGISFSDHERSLLLFREYSLEQLWDSDFEDMLHLLVWEKYPTALQRRLLSRRLAECMSNIPQGVRQVIEALPRDASPLPMLMAGLSATLAWIPDCIPASTRPNLYLGNARKIDEGIIATVSSYAVVFALTNCHLTGKQFVPASLDKTYYENMFTMAGIVDPSTGEPDSLNLRCFRRFAMLTADHGMALTTFSALVTASSLTDPISCMISAIAAAYGPLHFGATESAQHALQEIGAIENIPRFLEQVKTGKRRLFGYGHRAYKAQDPRVPFIKSIVKDLNISTNPLLKLAEQIEAAASVDDYFKTRKLYPNADFYGNFVFTAIGFQPGMIPAAMLAQRIMGIMAHWREYMLNRGKLFRPSHIYTGNVEPSTKLVAKM